MEQILGWLNLSNSTKVNSDMASLCKQRISLHTEVANLQNSGISIVRVQRI